MKPGSLQVMCVNDKEFLKYTVRKPGISKMGQKIKFK